AAISIVGELGLSVPGQDPAISLGQLFTADLAEIIRSREPRVSEAAARAVAKIAPDTTGATKVAVPALGELLTAPSPSQRFAAAEALGEMLQVLLETPASIGGQAFRVGPAELARVGQAVVSTAVRGLSDSNAAVRRKSAEAIFRASAVLTGSISART